MRKTTNAIMLQVQDSLLIDGILIHFDRLCESVEEIARFYNIYVILHDSTRVIPQELYDVCYRKGE